MGLDWATLSTPVIIAMVPILVMLIKKIIPNRLTWILPLIATALGPTLDWLQSTFTTVVPNSTRAILLGMSGVALREIIDQIKKATVPR